MLTEVFLPRGLLKIGKLLINNGFSVEQAFSYRSSKQVLLFVLIIFYLRSAKCFFFFAQLTIVFFKTIVWKKVLFSLNVTVSFADDIIRVVSSVRCRPLW